MAGLAGHFLNIITEITVTPDRSLAGNRNALHRPKDERILVEFNDTKAPWEAKKTIQQLFEDQVFERPEASPWYLGSNS